MKPMWVLNLGKIGYRQALRLQEKLHQERVNGTVPDLLLVVEHPPTITIGRSGLASDILVSRRLLNEQGIAVHEISRGGGVTYHGPGQVVCCPIIKLAGAERDLHRYLNRLEEVMIQTLRAYGLAGGRKPAYTGVWVGEVKIGAVGVAVRRYVTLHGFALNVNPEMNHFKLIIPCGIRQFGVTSLHELGLAVTMEEMTARVIHQCSHVLCRHMIAGDQAALKSSFPSMHLYIGGEVATKGKISHGSNNEMHP